MFGRRRKEEDTNEHHPGGLTREHVVWAYRLLLDRDPENEGVIASKLAGSRDTKELRHHLVTSAEYRRNNPDYAATNDRTLVVVELEDGTRLFVDLSDHVIGLNIVRGRYEADEIRLVRSLLAPGDVAIDIGAHIGFFTMQMAAIVGPAGRVYAFEPFAANAELLERSVLENHFTERVVFQRAAVGQSTGSATLTFAVETLNSGGAYLLREGTSPLTGNQTETVPQVALDDLIHRELRRPVRFIKMDVEGAEPLVVDGATRLLEADRPVILSELHQTQLDRASGVTADQFLRQMRGLGYRAHRIVGPAEAGPHRLGVEGLLGPALEQAPAEALVSVVFVHDQVGLHHG